MLMEALLATLLAPTPTTAPVQTITNAALSVTAFSRRELRRSILPRRLERRAHTMVAAVAGDEVVLLVINRRGRIVCQAVGTYSASLHAVSLQGCGFHAGRPIALR